MNRTAGFGRVQQQATRMPMPGTARISGTATPMASRTQFRGASADLLTRGGTTAPTRQRSDREDDDETKRPVKTDDDPDAQLDCDCQCDEDGDCDCDCDCNKDDDESLFAKVTHSLRLPRVGRRK